MPRAQRSTQCCAADAGSRNELGPGSAAHRCALLHVAPHPGQVKAEMNSLPRGRAESEDAKALEQKIHDMLFADEVEEAEEAEEIASGCPLPPLPPLRPLPPEPPKGKDHACRRLFRL